MSLGITQIETLLNMYLPPSTAAERARWVVEDMAAIGFRLELSSERPAGFWEEHGVLPQAEYVLQETQFSIDAENSSDALAGSFLTVGNLLRLAQTVAIARKWIPHLWPYEFQSRLLGIEHLNALNEIWWLKFWRGLVSVERGLKANNAVPDFEWSLSIHDGVANCRVNLEVKRRPGNINNWFKHQRPSA